MLYFPIIDNQRFIHVDDNKTRKADTLEILNRVFMASK